MENQQAQQVINELQTNLRATIDGYALAKAQVQQLTQLAQQLQDQIKELEANRHEKRADAAIKRKAKKAKK